MAGQRIALGGVSPQLQGKRWESETILRVGRLDTLEVFLDDPSISRRHAEILATDQGWMVRDLGSTNGTFLNGTRLGRTDRRLRREDVLQCGSLFLVVAELEELPQPRVRPAPAQVRVEASACRSWDQAMGVAGTREGGSGDGDGAAAQSEYVLRHLQTGYHLCHATTLAELLLSILEDTVTALDAYGGAIILADPATGQLDLTATRSTGCPVSIPEHRVGKSFSKTLAQRAFERGESLLGRDVTSNSPESSVLGPEPNALRTQDSGLRTDEGMASLACAVLRSPRQRLGVLHLDRGPAQEPFTEADLELADSIAAGVAVGVESMLLVERQRELFLQTVAALAQAVETRDCYTGGHTQRVTAYSLLLADELGLSASDRYWLQVGVPLHDLGKIGVHDRVLGKEGELTEEETAHVREHVLKGVAIVQTVPALAPALPIVRHHHERWDGTGYPDRLKGEAIPLLARVVAVADAFDAMTSDRPYRLGLPIDKALEVLRTGAYSQFDPDCVAAFIRLRPRIEPLVTQEAALNRLAASMPGTSPHRLALRTGTG